MTMPFYCPGCKNFNGNRKCDAFPEKIPEEYWTGDAPINEECNNGIKYEKHIPKEKEK